MERSLGLGLPESRVSHVVRIALDGPTAGVAVRVGAEVRGDRQLLRRIELAWLQDRGRPARFEPLARLSDVLDELLSLRLLAIGPLVRREEVGDALRGLLDNARLPFCS